MNPYTPLHARTSSIQNTAPKTCSTTTSRPEHPKHRSGLLRPSSFATRQRLLPSSDALQATLLLGVKGLTASSPFAHHATSTRPCIPLHHKRRKVHWVHRAALQRSTAAIAHSPPWKPPQSWFAHKTTQNVGQCSGRTWLPFLLQPHGLHSQRPQPKLPKKPRPQALHPPRPAQC